MKFSFLTLFPQVIVPYFESSIMARAIKNGIIEIETINIRDFATNRYKKVDSKLISGGAGMLLEPYTLYLALQKVLDSRIIFLSPVGAKFSNLDSKRLAKYSHISLVCGRYEGFDERIIEMFGDEIFSVGDFILSGGELAALCMADSIARNLDSVLGNMESLQGESFEYYNLESKKSRKDSKKIESKNIESNPHLTPQKKLLEAPNFTKCKNFDEKFENFKVISAFLKGNHATITDLKLQMSKMKTQYFRPDLI
ncbi:tRNA (guanosine(37)-N1)-methyltransferase TrmD [Helicobacter saguini]|uniref:tRNA (guanine-N(1)-)-methyltransferase n=1 Tax=Helicobacter saguini TaxID=1548018 RepID=A0A347VPM7_9HELI|nr:tRNA (guanosine(37)-N1)-methyltransferase TrmD [Helicobacter saguini]MWV61292.1 tRNA (guanosine(37)-N1)-methyltransferase TrmD [Helicobacter saguini]MWV68039.1 tRNA (guanosine(37)-N1)-methyltransferase TrmD [Helicobacter saguini]MWV70494.1 tRNA (guanosine(37)-N1)-methyltransferase TrmD [Helicobacter saguini]MWV72398.1 tRNA (guanosine(37)-N1)-methyltransferase TrmD [Helicobacter saguini]TLD91849.1 tRNA (guanosine(37)-N1)-methyltransferase TrmD [Helicobacter saguini]